MEAMAPKPATRSRTETDCATAKADHRAAAHPIMFWVLTSLALSVFTPCVLVPMWGDTQRLREYEQALVSRTVALEKQLERDRARAAALVDDPLVNERIVRRELRRRPSGEEVLAWSPTDLTAARLRLPEGALTVSDVEHSPADASSSPEPSGLAGWVGGVAGWLPDWPWHELFATSPNRPLLLAMSGGLLLSAFLLYGPRPRAKVCPGRTPPAS